MILSNSQFLDIGLDTLSKGCGNQKEQSAHLQTLDLSKAFCVAYSQPLLTFKHFSYISDKVVSQSSTALKEQKKNMNIQDPGKSFIMSYNKPKISFLVIQLNILTYKSF